MSSSSGMNPLLSSAKLVCFALSFIHLASALPNVFEKRATSAAPPARIDIPLLFDTSGRYVIPVGMAPGANEQHFNFTLATSTGLTSVAGTGCSSCSGINLYNQSASQSARPLDTTDRVLLVGGAYSGTVIKENCNMATSNGSSWLYPNQTIVVANSQSNGTTFDNGVSGIVGLGTNRMATPTTSNFSASFNDSIFGQWLGRNMDQDVFQFGMDLNPPVTTPISTSGQAAVSPTSTNAGTLHWLQPDSSAYNAQQVAYKTVQANSSVNYAGGSQPDWSVALDGWSLAVGSDTVSSSEQMVSAIDPYYTDIYFPTQQAQLINDAIGGSSLLSDVSSLGSQAQSWSVPCDARFTFTVTIGTQQFSLDQSTLVIQTSDGNCVSGIEGWTDSSIDEYIFGALFIQKFYLVFQIGRNGTDTVGFAPKTVVSKGADVGAIVGGTIGGVAGVLLIGVAVFFYIRSRQDRALLKDTVAMVEEHKVANTVEPYTLGAMPASAPQHQYAIPSPPGSPEAGSPLLAEHHDDIAPPSYEASEVGSQVGSRVVSMRTSKGEYIVPASSDSGVGSSAGGSDQPLVPNRPPNVYTIEE